MQATHPDSRWHVIQDDWLARANAWVRQAETAALSARGVFHIVLAGGATPRRLYQALAREAHDWPRWQIWFGDERCLPPADPERNSSMARDAWLDCVALPARNIHAIPAELGARAGALAYARELSPQGDFDLVLLGLGEDGHTASLFPGHDWGEGDHAPDTLAVDDAPKPPPQRVSLSARRLARARQVLFLVTGTGKREALSRWRRGEALPAGAIRPASGIDVLMDTDACPQGEKP